jgi:DNA polymerase IV
MRRVPTILHADMDAFYASVEQRDRPELRGKPVIVSGGGNRAVVLTASYEARPFGVHSAMPAGEARRLCPKGIFVAPRMRLYAEEARRIRHVFGEFTPLVEPLSLDEAFLDITASLRLFGGAREIGRKLRLRVREDTDLAVSVGIGPTKMIAKIAGGLCKPDGLLEVLPDEVESFLRPLPVSQLWGVGPKTQETLLRLGLHTVGAIADREPDSLERRLGNLGPALWRMAHGLDERSVEPDRQRKSYGEEETFETDLSDGPAVRAMIAEHAEAVARRLRADGCAGRAVTLKLKLHRRIGPGKYPLLTRRTTLATPTDDGKTIADAALALWDAAKSGIKIRLIGVSVSGIEPAAAEQLTLFAEGPRRQRALNQALDALASRFGSDAVKRGGLQRSVSTVKRPR